MHRTKPLAIADSPLARFTAVIRLIGIYRPIKLRDLEAHVSLSRPALQRIFAQLEALHPARRQNSELGPPISDKAFFLTHVLA